MNHIQRQRITPMPIILAIVMGAFATIGSRPALAASLDIPRIQAAAERGSVQEEIELGAAYLVGRGVERNEKQAAYWYERAANSGDPGAQRQIGYFYMAGIGVDRNPGRAVSWFERAISGGLIGAKVNLGVAYLWGSGVRRDEAMAVKYFEDAAAGGSGSAACYLGELYYFGKGVARDPAEARHWFETGAKLHDARAKHNLALMLSSDQSPANRERVVRLLRESEKAGFVPAKHQLGLFLLHNPGLAKSPREPLGVLEEAALLGSWKSSIVLGILARDGRGIPRSASVAYYHYRVAELQGGDAAATLLAKDIKVLSAELAEADIRRLDADAADWLKDHPIAIEYVFRNGEDRLDFPAFGLKSPEENVHAGLILTTPLNTLNISAAEETASSNP